MLSKESPNKSESNCQIYISGQRQELSQSGIRTIISNKVPDDFASEIIELFQKFSAQRPENNISIIKMNSISKKNESVNFQSLRSQKLNEVEKSVFGLIINKSSKEDVKLVLESISGSRFSSESNSFKEYIEELGIMFYYNHDGFIEQIEINNKFNGETLKGLRAGFSMEKAVELYGEPMIRSLVKAMWRDFSVFIKDEVITSIILR